MLARDLLASLLYNKMKSVVVRSGKAASRRLSEPDLNRKGARDFPQCEAFENIPREASTIGWVSGKGGRSVVDSTDIKSKASPAVCLRGGLWPGITPSFLFGFDYTHQTHYKSRQMYLLYC